MKFPERIRAANDRVQARLVARGFCAYTHSAGGVVRYVGSGRLKRPTDFSNRPERWRAVFPTDPAVTVLCIGASREVACLVEQSLIWAHRQTIINRQAAYGRRRGYDQARNRKDHNGTP